MKYFDQNCETSVVPGDDRAAKYIQGNWLSRDLQGKVCEGRGSWRDHTETDRLASEHGTFHFGCVVILPQNDKFAHATRHTCKYWTECLHDLNIE